MARKRLNSLTQCRFFQWSLTIRKGVFQADGRSNKPSTGRHSLNTRSREKAQENLKRLDEQIAVKRGLIDSTMLSGPQGAVVAIGEGVEKYIMHLRRPRVARGASPATIKRYRPVFNKAVPFFEGLGLVSWNQLNADRLSSYLAWLDGEGYAYSTEFFEGNVIKQASKYLVGAGLLPASCKISLHLDRPSETDTYCYREEEVAAMINHCRSIATLQWLADVIVGLAHTGMRISELANLSWACIDMPAKMIRLKDESRSRKVRGRSARTNKSRRSRRFPIHPTLYSLLESRYSHGISGRVFRAAKGGALHDGNLRKIFIEQVLTPLSEQFPSSDEEIGFKNGRLHSFRHYFCSWCANSGVSEQAVMDWLGHRDSAMVRHYYHLHDPQAQLQMLKLGTIPGLDAT